MNIIEIKYGGYDKVGYTTRELLLVMLKQLSVTLQNANIEILILFKYRTNGKGHLKGLFWCDSQCLLDYATFMVSSYLIARTKRIDTTCPLFLLLGVNHHGNIVLFACGIISRETIESYICVDA
jgi:zinc finger SWIM domain-containing protein 3